MLRVEPTNSLKFCSYEKKQDKVSKIEKQENQKSMLITSLAALAAAGVAAVGLKKTTPISYEKALEKAGVEIKNGIATVIKTGEKYTGKIQRYESRTKKETVNFVDGILTEKLYHNLLGKELEGIFYKEGEPVLKIWKSVGQEKNSRGFSYVLKGNAPTKPRSFVNTKDGFAWAREYLEKIKK